MIMIDRIVLLGDGSLLTVYDYVDEDTMIADWPDPITKVIPQSSEMYQCITELIENDRLRSMGVCKENLFGLSIDVASFRCSIYYKDEGFVKKASGFYLHDVSMVEAMTYLHCLLVEYLEGGSD